MASPTARKTRTALTCTLIIIISGCNRQSEDTIDSLPAADDIQVTLIKPDNRTVVRPREEVECVTIITVPEGFRPPQFLTTGIWKGERMNITTFGQVIDELEPDGVYRLEATLIAPKEPGRYTVKATATAVDRATRDTRRFHAPEVELSVEE